MAVITYREALNQALAEEMQRDPDVFLMGEGVGGGNGAGKGAEGAGGRGAEEAAGCQRLATGGDGAAGAVRGDARGGHADHRARVRGARCGRGDDGDPS